MCLIFNREEKALPQVGNGQIPNKIGTHNREGIQSEVKPQDNFKSKVSITENGGCDS